MADVMVSTSTGAMGSVLGKLSAMLSDEYKLLKGVHGDCWICPKINQTKTHTRITKLWPKILIVSCLFISLVNLTLQPS